MDKKLKEMIDKAVKDYKEDLLKRLPGERCHEAIFETEMSEREKEYAIPRLRDFHLGFNECLDQITQLIKEDT